MAFRVLMLSLQEGVRRVVIASSNHAADWYEHLIHVGIDEFRRVFGYRPFHGGHHIGGREWK